MADYVAESGSSGFGLRCLCLLVEARRVGVFGRPWPEPGQDLQRKQAWSPPPQCASSARTAPTTCGMGLSRPRYPRLYLFFSHPLSELPSALRAPQYWWAFSLLLLQTSPTFQRISRTCRSCRWPTSAATPSLDYPQALSNSVTWPYWDWMTCPSPPCHQTLVLLLAFNL